MGKKKRKNKKKEEEETLGAKLCEEPDFSISYKLKYENRNQRIVNDQD